MTSSEALPASGSSRREAPDRNLALELVRVTEAGAMAAGRWVGRGDKEGGDGAAVDAMRELVNSVSMRGVVVIGEGEKDEAPMLYNGELVGDGTGPEVDFAVDPVDGTTLMSKGSPGAIAVLAVADRPDHGQLIATAGMGSSADALHPVDDGLDLLLGRRRFHDNHHLVVLSTPRRVREGGFPALGPQFGLPTWIAGSRTVGVMPSA